MHKRRTLGKKKWGENIQKSRQSMQTGKKGQRMTVMQKEREKPIHKRKILVNESRQKPIPNHRIIFKVV